MWAASLESSEKIEVLHWLNQTEQAKRRSESNKVNFMLLDGRDVEVGYSLSNQL